MEPQRLIGIGCPGGDQLIGQFRHAGPHKRESQPHSVLAPGLFVERPHFDPFRICEEGEIARPRDVSLLKFRGGAHIQKRTCALQKSVDP